MKLPYNILLFKVFLHLLFSFNKLKSINSVLNYHHLRFSSHKCSDPLLLIQILNDSFTVRKRNSEYVLAVMLRTSVWEVLSSKLNHVMAILTEDFLVFPEEEWWVVPQAMTAFLQILSGLSFVLHPVIWCCMVCNAESVIK